MFLERLHLISQRIGEVRALSLVAADGIPVESVSNDPNLDLDALAAEILAQVHAIAKDQRELEMGDVEQFSLTTDRATVMVSSVGKGYYLLLVLALGGSYGRARFELRRARLLLADDLEYS